MGENENAMAEPEKNAEEYVEQNELMHQYFETRNRKDGRTFKLWLC